VRGEIVLPVSTMWGQDTLLYVDTKIEPCGQVPAEQSSKDRVGVKVGCPAVAVGQLINYWYENGYASGWLDRMLEGMVVYPRPWSFGGLGRAACTHPGFGAEDSYRSAGWDSLKRFLWHVGLGLDTEYDQSISGLKVYPSERLGDLVCPPQICGTFHSPDKIRSLLEGRFRFKVITGPSQKLQRLDHAAETIRAAIDARRPVLLMMSEGLGGAGHVALIQGYRPSFSGGLSRYDFQVNFGWGPKFPLRWVPGGGQFQTGDLVWKEFWVIDVVPVSVPAAQPVLTAAIKIGVLQDTSVAGGCGCMFSPASDRGQVSFGRVLFSSDTECNAWMNIDGRDVKLTAEGPTRADPDFPDARCDAKPATYFGTGIEVRVQRKVARECPPEPTECEVTDYDVTLTVEKGVATQSAHAQGMCGC
jgi:hypothetical protein